MKALLLNSFRIHTPRLLDEIIKGSGNDIYRIPINQLKQVLARVGKRAAAINDPELNALMCQLTIYSIANPDEPDYDEKTAQEIMNKFGIQNFGNPQ